MVVNLTAPIRWPAVITLRTMSSLARTFAASTPSITLASTETPSAPDAGGTGGADVFGERDGTAGDGVSAVGSDRSFGLFFTATFSPSRCGRTIITIRSGLSVPISYLGACTRPAHHWGSPLTGPTTSAPTLTRVAAAKRHLWTARRQLKAAAISRPASAVCQLSKFGERSGRPRTSRPS